MLSNRIKAATPSPGSLTTRKRKLFLASLVALVFVLLTCMLINTQDLGSNPRHWRSAAEVRETSLGESKQNFRKAHGHPKKLPRASTSHRSNKIDSKHKHKGVQLAEVPTFNVVTSGKRNEMNTQATTVGEDSHSQLTRSSDPGDGMAAHENFDAEKVYNLFCSCRKENDLLFLDCYINAYEELCKLFRVFGTVFSFVTSDVEEKIGILRDYRKSEHAEQYKTIQSMLAYEVASETVKKKKANSGSRTLLRLHRALEFITEFLLKLKESDNHCKFSSVVTKAYDDTLAKHHPWLVKKAVHVAMYMLPSRPDLLKKMGLEDEESDMNVVMDLVKELNVIYKITQELYAKDKLLDLP